MSRKTTKIQEAISSGKQIQFDGIPERAPKEGKDKKYNGRKPPTYWRCNNSHIFEVKQRVHPSKEDLLRCPECGAPMKNAVNKGAYMYYLNNHGRGDKKKYIKRFGEKGNSV